ncbi:ABC transporter ATP-binding protein [Gottfriedia acidiceleris]|uniref:ABC transporter ATP-binding protein/permease n=1 Tax=Gottfriedia acidiceleris TaxID=371036 RepID=A0ABY4JJ30_9BACI|nr:ABC transporter ATP-binding protein [Gottfriedia acidiceleris]UPM53109.1 ABC transporter ATP-binding protein/permease [Gottfriedia acidiceleris]
MKILIETVNHFKPYWKVFLIAFACSLIAGAFSIIPPILTGKLVDEIVGGPDSKIIFYLILGIMLSFLFKVGFESLQEFIQVKIGLDVITDMQLRAFTKLQKAPMTFFSTTPRGDMLFRLTHDVESVLNLNNTVIPRFIQQVIAAIAAFIAVFPLYWPAAVVMLIVFAIYLVPSFLIGKKVRKMGAIARDMSADLYNHTQESIESVRLVRTFQTQDKENKKLEDKLSVWKRFAIRLALIGKVNWRLGNVFNNGAPGVIMLIGGYSIWQHEITVGTLIAVLGFIPTMFMPVRSLAENALTIQQAVPALQRIYEYFDLPAEQPDDLPKFGEVKGDIEVNNIRFTYPNSTEEVLKDVSFSIRAGQHIGIVGSSGGGKSTLIQLLLGLYEPSSGSISVDRKDLSSHDYQSLRQNIGVVSQETFLLNSTLKQNLLYAKPNATDEELRLAVEAADLSDLVESLQEGFETIVGERGLKLSGGQRQRVALARAILRHPPVLIFDEATSSLDGETEEKVQSSLEKLIPGRTTITIAHRLVTVKDADCILLLDKGRIAEQGTHEELLSFKGQYYQLYMAQYSELA